MMIPAFLAGCSIVGSGEEEEDEGFGDVFGDTDTDTDTDADTDADTDTDTDSDTDSDADSDTDLSDLEGRTWFFTLADATLVEPEALEAFVDASQVHLLQAIEARSTWVDLRHGGALGDSDTETDADTDYDTDTDTDSDSDTETATLRQDPCFLTNDLDADLDGFDFEWTGSDLTTTLAGVEVDLYDVSFSGTFTGDLDEIRNGVLEHWVDTRPFDALIDERGDEGLFCELMVSFGTPCEDCPGGDPYCMHVSIEDIVAAELSDLDIEEVDESCE